MELLFVSLSLSPSTSTAALAVPSSSKTTSPPPGHTRRPSSPVLALRRRLPITSSRRRLQVVCMAPEEEKMTRRSPLDFPIAGTLLWKDELLALPHQPLSTGNSSNGQLGTSPASSSYGIIDLLFNLSSVITRKKDLSLISLRGSFAGLEASKRLYLLMYFRFLYSLGVGDFILYFAKKEWERPKPGRRPDIFPQFSPMKTPLPPPLPADPPEEDEEEEEKKEEEEEDPEKEEMDKPEQ